jgi:hypothetical protein
MKAYLLPLLALLLFACSKNDDSISKSPPEPTTEYLVFGHFYGMCLGEGCVEIFKLEKKRVLEDQQDSYPSNDKFYKGDFLELTRIDFEKSRNLLDFFPDSLLQSTTSSFGCPDCADQGGLYIEYRYGNTHRFWHIDQSKKDIPHYLHEFVDKVNATIESINS